MMTIGILTFTFFVMSAYVADGAICLYSKDSEGCVVVNCANQEYTTVPNDILNYVETLNLEKNSIGKLSNNSFTEYPNIKNLMLSFNRVHIIESGALGSLDELETLDLTENAIKKVPAGLPKSLTQLKLNGNPVEDLRQLKTAVGLQELQLRGCDLKGYPALGIMPSLINLDVSENSEIMDLDPAQLAATCRLSRLNVTGAVALFRPWTAGAHCRCRRVIQWAKMFKMTVFGLGRCPDPLEGDGKTNIHDDPKNEACARAPEQALAAFEECAAEWEYRNTSYWAYFASAVVITVAVLLALYLGIRGLKVLSPQSEQPFDSIVDHNKSELVLYKSTTV